MLRRLKRHPRILAAAAALLGGYLAFTFRTTRWTLAGADSIIPAARAGGPLIAAFWHERLPLMPELWRGARAVVPELRARRMNVLVSQHRDGRFIGDIVGRFDLRMVYGSSSRGGAQGMLSLLRQMEAGDLMAITPDGPRGPRRVAAPGVAQLAARSGALVIPCAAASTRQRRLRSWDRMVLPLPFGRAVLVVLPPIAVPPEGAEAALPAISAAMTRAAEIADAWVAQGAAPGAEGRPGGLDERRV